MQRAVLVMEHETLDDLILGGLKIIQPRKGYRFSLDPVLLAHFPELLQVHTAVDIGTGNGIIPLLLAYRSPHLNITAIDIQEAMVDRTRRSVHYNQMDNRIQVLQMDARNVSDGLPAGEADLVICNPPFMKMGEGKLKRDPEQATARHELCMELADVFRAGAYLLRRGGRITLIHRADRLADLILECTRRQFHVTRLRMVHAFSQDAAKLVLLEGTKGCGAALTVMAPLIVYRSQGSYSAEIDALYHPLEQDGGKNGVENE